MLSIQFQWTNVRLLIPENGKNSGITEWEVSLKTSYAMISANNTKWVSSYLFGCCKANSEPLASGYLHHMDPHVIDWVTKIGQVNRDSATYHFECDTLACWAICNTLLYVTKWQRNWESFSKIFKKLEGHFEITLLLNVLFTASELEHACVSSSVSFKFWTRTLYIKKIITTFQRLSKFKSGQLLPLKRILQTNFWSKAIFLHFNFLLTYSPYTLRVWLLFMILKYVMGYLKKLGDCEKYVKHLFKVIVDL